MQQQSTPVTYIQRIRNPRKRAYAAAYYRWLTRGKLGNGPEPQCSYMAAQAVRLDLNEMVQS